MKSLLHIKAIALSLLLIFSASIFAVCPCNHEKNVTVIKHKCCCKKTTTLASKKNSQQQCPCENKIIKFNKAEKQLTQAHLFRPNVIVNALLLQPVMQEVTHNFTFQKQYIQEKKLLLHHPPGYYIMYGTLRI
jgi:hypothetical protein